MNLILKNSIEDYLKQINSDPDHRFTSWNHCFHAFQTEKDTDILALHLAFYLASWGMYRGSSSLLQKNYKVHIGAVTIIKRYQYLQCKQNDFDVSKEQITDIIKLKNELKEYYKKQSYIKEGEKLVISPTDVLLSKIILGTLRCLPALDRYFVEGLKKNNIFISKITIKGLEQLFAFIEENNSDIEEIRKEYLSNSNVYYPTMKIVDMFFWQRGLKK